MTHRALQILRLPWTDNLLEGRFRVRDPDALAILAERDADEAMARLRNDLMRVPAADLHWTERLAEALHKDPVVRLEAWAESQDLAPETVSRGFHHAFGVAPRVFRLESRARRAWNSILLTSAPLTAIAFELGFSDLPHLTRSVAALTGAAPSYWRRNGAAIGPARQVRSSWRSS
jgi:AraC-like DNA-binding protein